MSVLVTLHTSMPHRYKISLLSLHTLHLHLDYMYSQRVNSYYYYLLIVCKANAITLRHMCFIMH